MIKEQLKQLEGKELARFSLYSILVFLMIAFVFESPVEIMQGMKRIIISRDALITDYFELANYGAAFFNAALVLGIAVVLVITQKLPFTGITMAVLFINAGYALWGKNPINILPILAGTILYAKVHRSTLQRYVYTALFGTCLAPMVTEMAYILPFPRWVNFFTAVAFGVFLGYILPPLVMHTASMHMGYNLFNTGFSAGILAFVVVSVLKSHGIESDAVFIWKEGRDIKIQIGLYLYFALTFIYGLWINRGDIKVLKSIMSHPGRAVTDFVIMDGAGGTLMNMGLIGIVCTTYIWLIGGDLSGPVVGAIFTAFGFAAFGGHLKNYLPVLAGVYLSTFFSNYHATTPGIQLAACFAIGLSPIAGQFGVVAGVIAGILHGAISMCTAEFYGGLNLYNNGFSAGWVAILMVPCLEGFMTHYQHKKSKKKH